MPPAVAPARVEEDKGPIEELFPPIIHRILSTTKAAIPASPAHTASDPQPFLVYWRSVFDKLHDEIVADESVPEHLSVPPATKVEVRLFERPTALMCPCCLPEVELGLTIENPAGVTKGEVVERVGRWLFADVEPRVWQDYEYYDSSEDKDVERTSRVVAETEEGKSEEGIKEPGLGNMPMKVEGVEEANETNAETEDRQGAEEIEEEITSERRRVVIYYADWLNGAYHNGKELDTSEKNWLYGEWPEIFLYGCPVENFEEMKKEVDEWTPNEPVKPV